MYFVTFQLPFNPLWNNGVQIEGTLLAFIIVSNVSSDRIVRVPVFQRRCYVNCFKPRLPIFYDAIDLNAA